MKSRIIPQNKVICDDCTGEFQLHIEENEIEPGIIEQFFQCPHCGARTTITITDPDMREKIERRKQLRKELVAMDTSKKCISHQRLKKLMLEDAKLKDELMQASRKLKQKYNRGGEEDADDHV